MNTLLLVIFYPAVALLVYTLLVIREMYLKQARNHNDERLSWATWAVSTIRMRSRRYYLIYLLILALAMTAISVILLLYPFNS